MRLPHREVPLIRDHRSHVIDTWGTTITPVNGVFELKRRDVYNFEDKDRREVGCPASRTWRCGFVGWNNSMKRETKLNATSAGVAANGSTSSRRRGRRGVATITATAQPARRWRDRRHGRMQTGIFTVLAAWLMGATHLSAGPDLAAVLKSRSSIRAHRIRNVTPPRLSKWRPASSPPRGLAARRSGIPMLGSGLRGRKTECGRTASRWRTAFNPPVRGCPRGIRCSFNLR